MLWSNSLQDSRVVLDTETQGKFRIESDTQVADLEDGQIGEVTRDDWVLVRTRARGREQYAAYFSHAKPQQIVRHGCEV